MRKHLALAGVIAGLLTGGLFVVVRTGNEGGSGAGAALRPNEASVLSLDGTLKCSARIPSRNIEPGDYTGLEMSITNVGDSPVELPGVLAGWVQILGANGRLLASSRDDLVRDGRVRFARDVPIRKVAPGEVTDVLMFDSRVVWPDRVRLLSHCEGVGADLGFPAVPPISVHATTGGTTPTSSEGITRALKAAEGLFATCSPSSSEVWTVGVIKPPDGKYSPMTARCMADVTEAPGYVLVTLTFIAPANAPEIRLASRLAETALPEEHSISIGRWSFIVTSADVKEVEALEGTSWTKRGNGYAVGIVHTDAGWFANSEGQCGGRFSVIGMVMISPCPR